RWMGQARAMVLSLEPAAVRRWGLIDRWGWESLHSWGLVEPDQREELETMKRALPAQLSCWSREPVPSGPDAGHPDTEVLERTCERLLARARGMSPRPAAFLDRDGTLVVERGYLASPGDLELLP